MDQDPNQQFLLFPRLPLEMRTMIWAASIAPRVVDVNLAHRICARTGQSNVSWRVTRSPAQLATSVEARRVVIQLYQTLSCACPPTEFGDGAVLPIAFVYFHPRMDVFLGRPLPRDFFDPLHDLAHIHVNLHITRASSRNPADDRLQTTTGFILNLIMSQAHNAFKTITLKITLERMSPPMPFRTRNLRPAVYRIVRRPFIPIPKPSIFFSGILSERHLAILQGQQPVRPRLMDTLLVDAAIFTRPLPGNVVALRVVDPTSTASQLDDFNWPGYDREGRWWEMLRRGAMHFGHPDVAAWLITIVGNPVPALAETSWGICGVNYGMGEAKAYSKPTDYVDWNWP